MGQYGHYQFRFLKRFTEVTISVFFFLILQIGDSGAQEGTILRDVTESYGLSGQQSQRVSFADLDHDGLPDLVVGGTRVWMNRATRFERSAWEAQKRVDYCAIADVNNDGNLDLFLGRSSDLSDAKFIDDGLRNEIWLGEGNGVFRGVGGHGVGQHAETSMSACFLDIDRDGFLDLFVGSSYTAYGKSYEAFPDRLYQGSGDGKFCEITKKAGLLLKSIPGLEESRRPTYGVTHTDWNNDGYQDLLVMSYGRQGNRLWKNNGDGTFTDVGKETSFDGDAERSGLYPPEVASLGRSPEPPFRSHGNTFDAAVADFDNDGDMDCFLAEITHWWAGQSSDRSMLLINEGREKQFAFTRDPKRIKRIHAHANWNQGDMHAGWIDIDNDGLLDLLIASSDYPDEQILRLWHQEEDHSFDEWTDRLGVRWINANQLSLADIDRDGSTDIVLSSSNRRLTKEQKKGRSAHIGLFKNTLPERLGNHFLNIRLEGLAIGARVFVKTGQREQVREVYGGLGHAGHRDDTDCRFGLGKALKADLVRVIWPDGFSSTYRDVVADTFYTLAKGGKLNVRNH